MVNRRTGEVDLQYQSGDDHAFSGVLLPLLKVGRMVLEFESNEKVCDRSFGDEANRV